MYKLNKKGFAISTILYGILTLASLTMFLIISTLSSSKRANDKFIGQIEKELNASALPIQEYLFDYTGSAQTFTAPSAGNYQIELWGASGGDIINGFGGYVSGEVTLNKGEQFFIYVGQQGVTGKCVIGVVGKGQPGGWNGGGASGDNRYPGWYCNADSGGGATDIRLINGEWNNQNGLRSRLMVAGAGSGNGDSRWNLGGFAHAGGLISYSWGDGIKGNISATQTSSGYKAQFGIGGNGDHQGGEGYGGVGGGGGYYGGSGGPYVHDFKSVGGSGGSSFISGHTGSVAITSQTNQAPKTGCTTGTTNNACSIHYSGKIFTNTLMIDGGGYKWTNVKTTQQQMPTPKGEMYPLGIGHAGNGYAKITLISLN